MTGICIAILDGPVQLSHPSLLGAEIEQEEGPDAGDVVGPALRHGTAVASLIFRRSPRSGSSVARRCKGVSLPIFGDSAETESSSAAILAQNVRRACAKGANIINISAGLSDARVLADPELVAAVDHCLRANVLIVAAAGPGGCRWPQLPASLPGVLAVEGRNAAELVTSRRLSDGGCISAPARYRVAMAGGNFDEVEGSSFACATVTWAAALFALHRQDRGEPFDAKRTRELIRTAVRSQTTGSVVGNFERFIEASTSGMSGQRDDRTPLVQSESGKQRSSQNDPNVTLQGQWRFNDRSPDALKKFAGLSADRFGKTQVNLPAGQFLDVADLHYPSGGTSGMLLVPAADNSAPGHQLLDEALRRALGQDCDDLYAILSYIHPEEHRVRAADLPYRSKLYLGQRHIGAYLGHGRTSHALEGHSRWRGDGQSSMQLNVDHHPANVHVVELGGVPPATLNRNARMVDAVIAGRANVPLEADTINCRTFELRSILMYYRDLLQGASYLEDLDWYTNCSVHKMIVLNVALNLPHNPSSFADILGDAGGTIWRAFVQAYEAEFRSPWSAAMETHFTPLWKLCGLSLSEIEPFTEREYHAYYAALREGRLDGFSGPIPLEPGLGMAWRPETLGDVLGAFVEMYCPSARVGDIAWTGCWLLLRDVLSQRIGLSESRFLDAVVPILGRRLASSAAAPPDASARFPAEFEENLLRWLDEAQGPKQAKDELLVAAVGRIAALARELIRNPARTASIDESNGDIANLRFAAMERDFRDGLFASPGIFHKLGLGLHAASPHVRFRTVCTAVDPTHLQPVSNTEHQSTIQTAAEGRNVSQEYPTTPHDPEPSSEWPAGPASLAEVIAPGPAAVLRSSDAGASSAPPVGQLVYALGTIAYDFPTTARRLSFQQRLAEHPEDPSELLDHLDSFPADAAALQWTFNIEGMPLYVLRPEGPFASDTYSTLRGFLRDQVDEGAERISLPGIITGHVLHRSGVQIPVVNPETRGMYSWTTSALLESLLPATAADGKKADVQAADEIRGGMKNFLERVYYEIRNLGREPWERALNYAATNAFEAERVFESAIAQNMELDSITVEPSPLTPAGSSYWDVKLLFFFPERANELVRRAYRFTVSVDDVVPTTIGPMRAWYVR